MEFLTVQNISYNYSEGSGETINALSEISFSVSKGETLFIAGANGSGKSTLLQIIAGCVKYSAGSIFTDGKLFNKGAERNIRTALVFQDPQDQLFMSTVWENVAFPLLRRGIAIGASKKAALDALAGVDAAGIADRAPHTLSGGEKQRAALASALVDSPDLLLLDEPTASLDPRARKNLIALLAKIECTKIIATHDLDMGYDTGGKLLILDKGKIAASGNAKELLQNETLLQSAGLELPLALAGTHRVPAPPLPS